MHLIYRCTYILYHVYVYIYIFYVYMYVCIYMLYMYTDIYTHVYVYHCFCGKNNMCFDKADGIHVGDHAESFRTQSSKVVCVLQVSRYGRFRFQDVVIYPTVIYPAVIYSAVLCPPIISPAVTYPSVIYPAVIYAAVIFPAVIFSAIYHATPSILSGLL